MLNSTDPYVVLLTVLITLTCGIFIWFATPRDDVEHVRQIRYFSHFFFFSSLSWALILVRESSWIQLNIFTIHFVLLMSFLMLLNGFRIRAQKTPFNMLVISSASALFGLLQLTFLGQPDADFIYRFALSNVIWFIIAGFIYQALASEKQSHGKVAAKTSLILSVIAIVIGALLLVLKYIENYEYVIFVYCIFYITLFGSISSLMLSDEVAKHQLDAETDELTGLKNRRFFLEKSSNLLQSGRRTDFPMSIILCDIDHFKQINDTYGHSTGDIAIKKITEVLTDNVRQQDLLARFGGEEFIVLLPQTDLQAAMDVSERMRRRIEQTEIIVPNSSFTLTSSFGVIEMIGVGLDANIARADKALYEAKSKGRNRVEAFAD